MLASSSPANFPEQAQGCIDGWSWSMLTSGSETGASRSLEHDIHVFGVVQESPTAHRLA